MLGGFIAVALINNTVKYLKIHKLINIYNNSTVHVWKNTSFVDTKSKSIRVGSFICVKKDEVVPADMVLLTCSGDHDKCEFEMKKIIGNDHPVIKKPLKETKIFRDMENPEVIKTKRIKNVKVSPSNKSFTDFKGKIRFKMDPKSKNLELHNFVISGSKLINNE